MATGLSIAAPAANAYKVPDLPYAFEALEPYIDAPTMKIHHDKHHATYVANINKATEGKEEKRTLFVFVETAGSRAVYSLFSPVIDVGGFHC